jgi:hypothetical protein
MYMYIMEKMIPDKGGFIYLHEDTPVCWLYAKLSHDKLKSSLPLSNTLGKTHLTAFFIDHRDYLGCGVEDDIVKLINKLGNNPINNDSEPTGIWKESYKEEFYNMKHFILNQLNQLN